MSARFWAKVNVQPTGCWLWTGAQVKGYGRLRFGGRVQPAHRVAYEMMVGPIPSGLTLDHLCHVKACVRPSHLEPVTQAENLHRARRDGLCAGKYREPASPERMAELAASGQPLTTREAADALGVVPQTIARWVDSGKLTPRLRASGIRGPMFFHPDDIERMRESA